MKYHLLVGALLAVGSAAGTFVGDQILEPRDINRDIFNSLFSKATRKKVVQHARKQCPKGTHAIHDTCARICPPDQIPSAATHSAAFPGITASGCVPCDERAFKSHKCKVCPVGKITSNSSGCLPCAPGRAYFSYAAFPGIFGKQAGGECAKCSVGQYSMSGIACKRCTAGHGLKRGMAVGFAADDCVPCPPGYFSPVLPKSVSKTMKLSGCWGCAAGSYQPRRGSISCLACTAGHYGNATAQAMQGACKACAPGQFSAAAPSAMEHQLFDKCTSCTAGRYQAQRGRTSCFECKAGFYQAGEGGSSCEACALGKYAYVHAVANASIDPMALHRQSSKNKNVAAGKAVDPAIPHAAGGSTGATSCRKMREGFDCAEVQIHGSAMAMMPGECGLQVQ
jgi:hypothetical protein